GGLGADAASPGIAVVKKTVRDRGQHLIFSTGKGILMTVCQRARSGLPSLALRLLCCSGFLLSALLSLSQAQITLDGSLGPRGPLRGPHYLIADSVGQIRGPNLFHSFGQFNLSQGESATFTGPNTIANILSRVTGGS